MRFQQVAWVAICLSFLSALACTPIGAREETSFERWKHLDARAQDEILRLARRAFDAYITRTRYHCAIRRCISFLPLCRQRTGVFVSAMRQGAPRCCMGTLYPMQPNAALEIIENAVAAAGRDRRFAPIKPGEAKSLTLIVSIVGKPVPISASEAANLDPTREGLVVKAGDRQGVVLSGETGEAARMLQWGRIRAGAHANSSVELFRLEDVRFVEPQKVR